MKATEWWDHYWFSPVSYWSLTFSSGPGLLICCVSERHPQCSPLTLLSIATKLDIIKSSSLCFPPASRHRRLSALYDLWITTGHCLVYGPGLWCLMFTGSFMIGHCNSYAAHRADIEHCLREASHQVDPLSTYSRSPTANGKSTHALSANVCISLSVVGANAEYRFHAHLRTSTSSTTILWNESNEREVKNQGDMRDAYVQTLPHCFIMVPLRQSIMMCSSLIPQASSRGHSSSSV